MYKRKRVYRRRPAKRRSAEVNLYGNQHLRVEGTRRWYNRNKSVLRRGYRYVIDRTPVSDRIRKVVKRVFDAIPLRTNRRRLVPIIGTRIRRGPRGGIINFVTTRGGSSTVPPEYTPRKGVRRMARTPSKKTPPIQKGSAVDHPGGTRLVWRKYTPSKAFTIDYQALRNAQLHIMEHAYTKEIKAHTGQQGVEQGFMFDRTNWMEILMHLGLVAATSEALASFEDQHRLQLYGCNNRVDMTNGSTSPVVGKFIVFDCVKTTSQSPLVLWSEDLTSLAATALTQETVGAFPHTNLKLGRYYKIRNVAHFEMAPGETYKLNIEAQQSRRMKLASDHEQDPEPYQRGMTTFWVCLFHCPTIGSKTTTGEGVNTENFMPTQINFRYFFTWKFKEVSTVTRLVNRHRNVSGLIVGSTHNQTILGPTSEQTIVAPTATS